MIAVRASLRFWLIGCLAVPSLLWAQADRGVLVFPRHPVYEELERLEALGKIRRTGLATRPLRRSDVWQLLNALELVGLSSTDRALVLTYRAQFRPREPGWSISGDEGHVSYSSGGSEMTVGPSAQFRTSAYSRPGTYTVWRQVGIEGFGHVQDRFAMQGTFHTAAQQGSRTGPPASHSPERGVSGWARSGAPSTYYYDLSEGGISVSWSWGGAWWGKYPLSWGPGLRGQLSLSDKPPSSPLLMLFVSPWPWFRYHFIHAQLESGIVDSTTVRYPPAGTFSRFYEKYLVAQRFDIYVADRLRISAYESVVYGARSFDTGYLIPFVDLRHIQHVKGDRDNVQIGADMSVWWPRSTRISAALFVDELRLGTLFDKDRNRNWAAFQIGVRIADLWGLWPGTMTSLEYTRLNPFVYDHRYPWSTFATAGNGGQSEHVQYPLGYWLGQNADELYGEIAMDVTPRVRLNLWAEHTRKAPDAQTADGYAKDYRAVPFLSGPVTSTTRGEVSARLIAYRNILITASTGYERVTDANGSTGEWRAQVLISWNSY